MNAKAIISQRCDAVSNASIPSRLAMYRGGACGVWEWCRAVSRIEAGFSVLPP